MKKSFFIILTFFLIFSSKEILSQEKKVIIKGKIENCEDYKNISLKDIITGDEIISVPLNKKGKFKIKTEIENGNFYRLCLDEDNYILLILLGGEKVKVEADFMNLFIPEISGSEATELIYKTFRRIEKFNAKLDSLAYIIENEKKEFVRQTILKDPSSLSNLFFLDNLDMNSNLDVFTKLDSSLYEKYPQNLLVQRLHDDLKNTEFLAIGSQAPEIKLPNLENKEIALSSLQGKYVLIDFWAAWCAPCRKKNKDLVYIQNKFKNSNFQIYSVSLDQSKETWEKAIKDDNLEDFIHVSDLKYWQSIAAETYKIEAIPFNVFIDKNGKILAKNIEIKELEKILNEILD